MNVAPADLELPIFKAGLEQIHQTLSPEFGIKGVSHHVQKLNVAGNNLASNIVYSYKYGVPIHLFTHFIC